MRGLESWDVGVDGGTGQQRGPLPLGTARVVAEVEAVVARFPASLSIAAAFRPSKTARLTGLSSMVLALVAWMPWVLLPTPVTAQATWTPEVLDRGPATLPTLVVDAQGQAHALWVHHFSQSDDAGLDAVVHARQDHSGTWTAPVDVFVPPAGRMISWVGAVPDGAGMIHLIVTCQDGLYYTGVLAHEAGRASNWREPVRISRAQTGPSSIAVGPEGILHVIYPEIQPVPGIVFYTHSLDGGRTWSQPQYVKVLDHPQAVPINAQMALGPSGRLHAVWTETIELFPPSGVFYAYSEDGGLSWSEPQMMAGRGHSWISVGLEADDRRVHLIWTGTGEVRGKYHALSLNGGDTWGDPELVFEGWAGFNHDAAFALDSAGTLHVLTAMSGGVPSSSVEWSAGSWSGFAQGEIFHSTWLGDSWSVPEQVSAATWSPELENGHYAMAVAEGNLLHIVWSGFYHPDQADSRVWYAARRLDTPHVGAHLAPTMAPRALRTPTPSGVLSGLATEPATVSSTPAPTFELPLPDDAPAMHQATGALWVGVVPAAILVISVVVGSLLRRRG